MIDLAEPLVAHRKQLAASCAASPDAPRSPAPLEVAVMIHDEQLQGELVRVLALAGLSCDLAPSRSSRRDKGHKLIIVDAAGLAAACHHQHGVPVAVLCNKPDLRQRVQLMAAGAERVLDAGWRAKELRCAIANLVCISARSSSEPSLADLFSTAPVMQELVATARLLVDAPSSVLITGETGVGKEHLARALHAEGPHASSPFLAVNCGALPESLLESVLFGHRRGAFTGADRSHRGVFEAAESGTLLLDEIGEMPRHLQVKLLTVLERREVVPLGDSRPAPVRARLMAATNRDLARDVERGDFRADLFFRLNVVHLHVPPLQGRREDIADLLGRTLFDLRDTVASSHRIADIDGEALDALLDYAWPGNVRELRNAVERALVLGRDRQGDKLRFGSLPAEVRAPGSIAMPAGGSETVPEVVGEPRSLKEARAEAVAVAERTYLKSALRAARGRITETARLAGIVPRSLYDKMKRYGLRKEDYRTDPPRAG